LLSNVVLIVKQRLIEFLKGSPIPHQQNTLKHFRNPL